RQDVGLPQGRNVPVADDRVLDGTSGVTIWRIVASHNRWLAPTPHEGHNDGSGDVSRANGLMHDAMRIAADECFDGDIVHRYRSDPDYRCPSRNSCSHELRVA